MLQWELLCLYAASIFGAAMLAAVVAHCARHMNQLVSFLNMFGAGVLLAAGLVHLLPDAVDMFEAAKANQTAGQRSTATVTGGQEAPFTTVPPNGTGPAEDDEDFPWIFFAASGSIYMFLLVEAIVLKSHTRVFTRDMKLHAHSADICTDKQPRNSDTDRLPVRISGEPHQRTHEHAGEAYFSEKSDSHAHALNEKLLPNDDTRAHNVVFDVPSGAPTSRSRHEDVHHNSGGGHGHSHGAMVLAGIGSPSSSRTKTLSVHGHDVDTRVGQGHRAFLAALLLVLALGLHSFLAGFAMGVASGDALSTEFIAIIAHKTVAALAIAAAILKTDAAVWKYW